MAKLIGKGTSTDFATFAEAGILSGNYNQRAFEYLKLSGGSGKSFNLIQAQAEILGVSLTPEPIDPATLFASGERGGWYDPSDLSTMFVDFDETTPVSADGDLVTIFKDKSGNGNHLEQTTTDRKPVYRTDGVLHWIEDGTANSQMISDTLSESVIQTEGFLGAAWSPSDSSEFTGILGDFDSVTTENGSFLCIDPRDPGTNIFVRARSPESGTADISADARVTLGDVYVSTANRNSSGLYSGYLNGVEPSSSPVTFTDVNNSSSHKIYLLAKARFANYFKGKFFGGILVGRELTTPERQGVEAYLGEKSGATITF